MGSESARERFERLLEQLEDERGDPWDGQLERIPSNITVEEDEDAYVATFDMSSYDSETVSAHVEDRTLVVTAERFADGRDERLPAIAEPSGHRLDSHTWRRYTAREEVAFPAPVEESSIDLTVTDGVATITLEKAGQRHQQSSAP